MPQSHNVSLHRHLHNQPHWHLATCTLYNKIVNNCRVYGTSFTIFFISNSIRNYCMCFPWKCMIICIFNVCIISAVIYWNFVTIIYVSLCLNWKITVSTYWKSFLPFVLNCNKNVSSTIPKYSIKVYYSTLLNSPNLLKYLATCLSNYPNTGYIDLKLKGNLKTNYEM